MSRKSLPALSRRMFLVLSGIAAAALALPHGVLAAEPEYPAVSAVAFDGDSLLAGGANLVRSDDGGQSWTELSTPGPIQALATHSERPGRVLAGLASGGVALSEDGGRTWEIRSDGLPEGEVDAVAVASGQPDMVYATVRDDGLWKSEDAGQSWSFAMDRPWLEETERDLLTLASVDLETGMGGIWIYAGTEAGLTRVPDCFCRWQDVQPGNAMDALVAGDAPPSEAPLPAGEAVRGLASAPSAPDTLYSALPSGIWTSRDGGVVWLHLMDGSASAVAVHPSDPMQVVAVLDGSLQISRDGGATWAALAVE
ncbi:sialidase family protein [Albimonas pacifica]|nr:sialidase family protein [Albimonas pacifica]